MAERSDTLEVAGRRLTDYEEDGVPRSMSDALRALRAALGPVTPTENPYLVLLDPDDLS